MMVQYPKQQVCVCWSGRHGNLEIPTYTETALHILYNVHIVQYVFNTFCTYRTSVARDGKLEWTID